MYVCTEKAAIREWLKEIEQLKKENYTGDKITIKDLLYGVLLPSGSDAVNAVVRVTSKSEEDFVKLMNNKVKELGLKNTNFKNAAKNKAPARVNLDNILFK